MTKKQAIEDLRGMLSTGPIEVIVAVRDCLWLGAGIPIRQLASIVAITFNLSEGIIHATPGDQPDSEFVPVHCGDWEAVIATLVIEADWDRIRRAADDLRADAELVELRREMDAAVRSLP